MARCRNGHFCKVLYRGEYIDRVYCELCEQQTQALWRDEERLDSD
jgi:hypothetical protein